MNRVEKQVPTTSQLAPKTIALPRNDRASTQSSRKRKSEAKPGKEHPISYAKIAKRAATDELCYAVIDRNNPTGKIPSAQRQCLEEAINTRIMDYILEADEDATKIQVNSYNFTMDVLMLQLASKTGIDILRKLVEEIPAPWEGAKLALVNRADIPSLTKSSVFIKGWGSKFSAEQVLKVLGKQNRGLVVEKWEIFHREETQTGTLIVVGIDQDSMTHLKQSNGKAFFVSQAVYFKVGKNIIGGDKSDAKPADGSDDKASCKEVSGTKSATNVEGESMLTNSQEDKLLAES